MGRISKTFALILTLIIAMSCLILLTAKTANAETTTAPSTPQFSLQLVGPPINHGYTNQYSYVLVSIKNQPYLTSSGTLYYNVRIKGHNDTAWSPPLYDRNSWVVPSQSTDSDHTNISSPLKQISI